MWWRFFCRSITLERLVVTSQVLKIVKSITAMKNYTLKRTVSARRLAISIRIHRQIHMILYDVMITYSTSSGHVFFLKLACTFLSTSTTRLNKLFHLFVRVLLLYYLLATFTSIYNVEVT